MVLKMMVDNNEIIIEGPVSANKILSQKMSPQLTSFRTPQDQQKALAEIACLPEGMIYTASTDNTIIGYITFHYPDPLERWGQIKMEELLEFGAIEVCAKWRKKGIASNLLRLGFSNPEIESQIIISSEFYWHWDLERTNLNVWEYKKMLECTLQEVGFQVVSTDDPEIISHPANSFMVRYGENVSKESIVKFESFLFLNKRMY